MDLFVFRTFCGTIHTDFLGIDCPRGARNGTHGVIEADPFSDEALAHTKEKCMHKEVTVLTKTFAQQLKFFKE